MANSPKKPAEKSRSKNDINDGMVSVGCGICTRNTSSTKVNHCPPCAGFFFMATDYGNNFTVAREPHATKTPVEVVDFMVSWVRELDGQAIQDSDWDAGGLTEVESSFTSSRTTVRLAGGEDGNTYEAENTITTDAGDVFSKRLIVLVDGPAATLEGGDTPDIPADTLLTEDGEPLLTEDGNYILVE